MRGYSCVAVACLALAGCTRFGVNPYGERGPAADTARADAPGLAEGPARAEGGAADRRADGERWDRAVAVDGVAIDSAVKIDEKPVVDGAADKPVVIDKQVLVDKAVLADKAVVADKLAPLAGLVAAWPLDDGIGQVASATVGSAGFLGQSAGADAADPSWEKMAARVCAGSALTFDGNDDIVTIPGPSTAGLAKFTITFSLYAAGAGGGSLARILSKENGGSSDTLVHYRYGDSAIAVNMFNTADTLFATFASGVVMNKRANWALTYDDTGDRRLHAYRNGNEATYARQDVMTGTLRTTTNSWMIGNQSSGVRAFDGTIDEVRVFNRVLSKSEIVALSSLCPPPP